MKAVRELHPCPRTAVKPKPGTAEIDLMTRSLISLDEGNFMLALGERISRKPRDQIEYVIRNDASPS